MSTPGNILDAVVPLEKLTKDLKEAAQSLSPAEVGYLVSFYYQVQAYRIRAFAQERVLAKEGKPHDLITWAGQSFETLELNLKRALDAFSSSHIVGMWCKSIMGIGPVIAAGLLAYVDIEKAPTAGHIWSFAGLNPDRKWLGAERARLLIQDVMGDDRQPTDEQLARLATAAGRSLEAFRRIATVKKSIEDEETHIKTVVDTGRITRTSLQSALAKRPYNSEFKSLCAFKLGESFVKFQNREGDFYGKLYRMRKDLEVQRNEAGEYAELAARILTEKKFRRETDAYEAYSNGRLPKAHLHARARRWAVKIFISHFQQVYFFVANGRLAPKPYVLDILGHAHEIQIPNAELVPGLVEAWRESK